MVASGHMTGSNINSYYYSIVSLRSMCTIFFLYELNNIVTCTGDIINAYLTTRTTEKISINAGTELAPFVHAGHLILFKTAIYGLNSSGARFHF